LANVLGYKHWSDMNAADKMAENPQAIEKFIGKIDTASKDAADREYQMLLASARKQDPSLQQIGL
jgi:thimet oligopeptidase